MKKFIKENWFKFGVLIAIFLIVILLFFYYIYFLPHKEKIILEQQEKNQAMQTTKEKQDRENKFKDECIEEKKAQEKQFNDFILSCKNELCINNASQIEGFKPKENYISNCINRKLQGLPTFGY